MRENANALLTGADAVAGEAADDDVLRQRVGVLRGKPGRGGFCVSLSCSDKLARWRVLGGASRSVQSHAQQCGRAASTR